MVIKTGQNIKYITTNVNTFTISQLAYDKILFMADVVSLHHHLKLLDKFSVCSSFIQNKSRQDSVMQVSQFQHIFC